MRLLLALAVLLTGAVACGGTAVPAAAPAVLSAEPTPDGTYRGTELDPPQPRPTFTLTDTTGARYDLPLVAKGA